MLDHKIKVFYHLAKNPNTTRVAEELLLSQPAISKSIRELEKDLGISLFDREKGRMHLTEAGRYLLSQTETLLCQEREIMFEIGRMRECFEGTLHIGASTTLSQYVLPEVLARFSQQQPRINMELTSGNTNQIEQEVEAGNLQLAFIEGTPSQPGIHYIPYLKDEIVLVSASGTLTKENISLEELRQIPLIFREKGSGTDHIIRKQLKEAGVSIGQLRNQLILGSTEGIKHYLLHSDCFALLSIYSIQEELTSGRLKVTEIEGLSLYRTFYMIHKQGEPDPYARLFMDFIMKQKS